MSLVSLKSLKDGLADVGNSSVGDSDTAAHQTMADNTTVGDAMSDDTTVGNAMADTNNCSGEGSSAIISDFGNISVDVVGMVVDRLDPAVGEIDRVGSLDQTGAVVALLLTKGGLRVVVGNSIGVTVRMVA